MSILTKDQILEQTLSTLTLDVPPWGDDAQVRIKELTSERRDYFEATMIVDAQKGVGKTIQVVDAKTGQSKEVPVEKFRARMVAMSLVDEDGEWMFEPGDEDKVCRLGAQGVNLIADAVLELNGMTKKEVDEIKKDLGQIQEEDSSSN
jgi:hypothetical protein